MSSVRRPFRLAAILWVISLLVLGYGVVSTTEDVRYAEPPATSTFALAGVKVMTAFHKETGIGMEFGLGALVLLIYPFLVGTVLAIALIVRSSSSDPRS